MTTREAIQAVREAESQEQKRRAAEHSFAGWTDQQLLDAIPVATAEPQDADAEIVVELLALELERRGLRVP